MNPTLACETVDTELLWSLYRCLKAEAKGLREQSESLKNQAQAKDMQASYDLA